MNEAAIYICKNCFPEIAALPSQWEHAGSHVKVKLIPCSGKIDAQYMMHAFEGGIRGLCVVTCPEGKCKLSQGNYRARMRVGTVQRLLSEAGIDPGNARIVQCDGTESAGRIREIINDAVAGFKDPVLAAH
jgi:coenzyme F420-reducing hydrogenase delta subunit